MAKDEAADGPQSVARKPVDIPFDRLDLGDLAQRAEMEGAFDPELDEPLEMVDAPIQIRPPFSPTDKKRNQRPLPT